ncbi:hypothetical protein ABKV19_019308 [Rosa sericea]
MADNEDRPIYLQVISSGPFPVYVIEEKKGTLENEASSKWGKQKISVVLESKRDRIKRLPSPARPDEVTDLIASLVAVNSKLYLMGVRLGLMVMDMAVEDENQWRWVSLWSGYDKGTQNPRLLEAVAGEDGCMYALKSDRTIHRICHDDHDNYPSIQAEFMDHSWKRLFGLTKNSIYMQMNEGIFCYDLKSGSFDLVEKNIALPLKAVIPYNERYLCTYKYSEEGPEEEEDQWDTKYVPGIYVYDTKQHQWLPRSVQGLPTDGEILPRPVISCEHPGDYAYLLQIGTHQGSPKLALVWYSLHSYQTSNFTECQLHCCKFILHIQEDADTSHPNFMAEILSTGIYQLGEDTAGVINCTAGVMMTNGGASVTETSLGNDNHVPLA